MAKSVYSSADLLRASEVIALFWNAFAREVGALAGSDIELSGVSDEQLLAAAQAAAQAFVDLQEPQVQSSFPVECVADVDYGRSLNWHVRNGPASSYAKENLTNYNFPQVHRITGILFSRYALLGPYGHKVSGERVLAAATRLGLHRPTPEDTLVVGRARPDLIVVGMVENPWINPEGRSCVPVVVRGHANLFGSPTGDWLGDRAFLFRR